MILHSAGDVESYPLYTSAPCIAVHLCSETNNLLTLNKSKFEHTARMGSVRGMRISASSHLVCLCALTTEGEVSSPATFIHSLRTIYSRALETDATVFFQYRARHFPQEVMAFIKEQQCATVFLSKVDNAANRVLA